MNNAFTTESVRYGYVSEETALLVDDYPYGFRLRTSIRYWIETTKRGDRFVSQTLNPKTDRWNKPKKSTYSDVGVMFLNEEGHVTWATLTTYSDAEWLAEFRSVTEGNLSDAQKKSLAYLLGVRKVMEGVTFSVREGRMTPEEEADQARMGAVIQNRINVAATENLRDLA